MSGLLEIPSFAFAFVAMLGVLIFVHELGHFLVAKACGVRVLKFSLGFGSPIGIGRFRLRWERNGTEYVAAWFPLGGFVKMLGENPDDEDSPETLSNPEEAMNNKPIWQRLAIVFAGPAMNLLLPVLIFTVQLGVGIPRGAPVVGTVEPASPAAEAGIVAGDRIVAIDGEPVDWWTDADARFSAAAGETLQLDVERQGETHEVSLAVAQRSRIDNFGAVAELGWTGLLHPRQRALIGVRDAASPAARAGLLSGDEILSVGEAKVEDWTSFAAAYAEASPPVTLTAARPGDDGKPVSREITVPTTGSVETLGVIPAAVLIAQVTPDSAAGEAGLAAGDLIVAVDGAPLGSFGALVDAVRSSDGRALQIDYARAGETRRIDVAPRKQEAKNALGVPETRWLIGIQSEVSVLPGASTPDLERNPLVAIPRAVGLTADATGTVMLGFKKLITGEVERNNIAGPIGIAVIAHKALQAGWEIYLGMLIMISINLGILNLLPIPVLDGGQAVLFIVEGIKRGPLSLRTKELFQTAGVMVLLMLMGFAMWNDVSRFWGTFVDFLKQSTGL
ncbi:MAG: RIP metalloprotease RseP [Deltaproteobacteria bacterium]|nr:RIP metalloprotease RseP [Deltaproteobacteria bacterium]MBW2445855.1 RIP metalloprotease RseP [Deltaproteobacteria bacterium]